MVAAVAASVSFFNRLCYTACPVVIPPMDSLVQSGALFFLPLSLAPGCGRKTDPGKKVALVTAKVPTLFLLWPLSLSQVRILIKKLKVKMIDLVLYMYLLSVLSILDTISLILLN